MAKRPCSAISLVVSLLAAVLLAGLRADAAPPGEAVRLEKDATDQTLAELDAPDLKVLTISSRGVSDEGIRSLKKLKRLETLILTGVPITNAGVEHLVELPNLKTLLVRIAPVSDEGLKSVGRMQKLTHLQYGGAITGRGLVELKQLKDLRNLSIVLGPGRAAGFEHLAAMIALRELSIEGGRIDEANWKHITALPELQVLRLRKVELSDPTIAGVGHCKKLVSLAMREMPIGDDAMPNVAKLDQLQFLMIPYTQVGTEGIRALLPLQHIKLLGLSACKRVDDDLVGIAAKMTRLEELQLDGTSVTQKGAEELRRALPEAFVDLPKR